MTIEQRAKQPVSFVEFIPMPSFVFDPHPLRLRGGPRLRAALSELSACAGSVLLLHCMHVLFIFPLLRETPRLELIPALGNPVAAAILFIKFAAPSHLSFILLFYSMWHCAANFAAEITAYADRTRFYGLFLAVSWFRGFVSNFA
jgi:hypothetical protein